MLTAFHFIANWTKWYRVLRYRNGLGVSASVRYGIWLARSAASL
jgi:hypothetical protein